MKFYNRISEICKNHKKVALFVDMDGTIVEYRVFPENFVTTETKEVFLNAEPLEVILKNLEKIANIDVIIFLKKEIIVLKGNSNIFIIVLKILVKSFTKILLNVDIYIRVPIIIPKNIYTRISPLLKYHILYNIKIPVKIQNKMSCMYVAIFPVFIVLLRILKKSNKIPITTPVNEKTKNKYAWFWTIISAFLFENFT